MPMQLLPARASLSGTIQVPGDKSISHRAALLAALALGTSRITGYNPGEDTRSTLQCLESLGAAFTQQEGTLLVQGRCELLEPDDVLDCGNSGTTMRLLLGILTAQPFFSVVSGDGSLRQRPMGRVVAPLTRMGATIEGRARGTLAPLGIRGRPLTGADHRLPVASAQVKSALLLAGLFARGRTRVTEPYPSRDHTERLMAHTGLSIQRSALEVAIEGPQTPRPFSLEVPGDVSSAAFFLVAGCLVPGSCVTVCQVGLNPTRTGFLRVLEAMGAQLEIQVIQEYPEPVGQVTVRGSSLQGTEIPPQVIPSLIDELPVLAVAAAAAQGITVMRGVGELRHKESDRLQAIATLLTTMGIRVGVEGDDLTIIGGRLQGSRLAAGGDHRLAMMAAVASLCARGPTTLVGHECVSVSYPTFFATLAQLRGEPPC